MILCASTSPVCEWVQILAAVGIQHKAPFSRSLWLPPCIHSIFGTVCYCFVYINNVGLSWALKLDLPARYRAAELVDVPWNLHHMFVFTYIFIIVKFNCPTDGAHHKYQVGSYMSRLYLFFSIFLLFICYHMITMYILNTPWTFFCMFLLEPSLQAANAQISLVVTAQIAIRALSTVEECANGALLYCHCIITYANRRQRCWLATCCAPAYYPHYRLFHCTLSFLLFFFIHDHACSRVLCCILGAWLLCRSRCQCSKKCIACSSMRASLFRI